MNWTDRLKKGMKDRSPPGPQKSGSGIKVVEAENDFPILRPDSIRIGSAHARECSGNRESLADLLGRFCAVVNNQSGVTKGVNSIRIEEKE